MPVPTTSGLSCAIGGRMLVERDMESALLDGALTECASGNGGAVTITGPVGSGKTALLRLVAQRAVDAGFTFLIGKGSRAERDLPMGLMGQVFAGAGLPEDATTEIARLLDSQATTPGTGDGPVAEHPDVRAWRGLTRVLLELADRTPLLIGIDDAHLADTESMQYLLYLLRRIDRARMLIVINESGGLRRSWPMLAAELQSQANSRQLRLNLLSPAGVATALARHPDLSAVSPPAWHRVSGGNPLLLNALVEDHRVGRPGTPEPAAGEAYAQAVLTCLYRGDESMLPVARGLAVLDGPATPRLLDELVRDICPAPTGGLTAITEVGILADGRFRHPRAAAAVLDAMSPDDRADLHERVAKLLYRNGAPALTVARHKLAARRAGAPWSVPLLHEAAEQALAADDTTVALDCLRLAERGRDGITECVRIQAALLRTSWRLDPATAERYTPSLLKAGLAGELPVMAAAMLVKHLMWFGRPAQAAAVLAAAVDAVDPDDPEAAITLYPVESRFAYVYPELAGQLPCDRIRPPAVALATSTGKLRIQTAGIIDALRHGRITEDAVDDAQAILQQHRIDDHTYDGVLAALEILVAAEHLETAAFWCDSLLTQADERHIPTWSALLSSIRAVISFRQGDMLEAERHASTAMCRVQPGGLGIFVGIPLSVLLLSATRRGQFEKALRLFAVPVPDVMFRTPFGLQYLRARGRFHLARGSYKAAMEDFGTCGELVAKWGGDLPAILPWRTDLAQARLALGLPGEDLVTDQLARLGPANRRTRGITLRVLAAATDPAQRVPILREAVDELQAGGDQTELIEALTELGAAQRALGEHTKARTTHRRAQQVATKHDLNDLVPARPVSHLRAEPAGDSMIEELSDAERRVAALAARGHTNQQIARKLFITVSTVEQHLTRVYRKLRINRRSDLPFSLAGDLRNTA
ncbi:AAA family ATPase [Polymorphospora sp. NPDC051019]|uniref:helix-turn-helix transcriptional regulator n=1 Tax=Polymorphospora sp. NPDC051019 TaxID=3155725 RepID=UPI00342E2092